MKLQRFLLSCLLSLTLVLPAHADFIAVAGAIFRVSEQTGTAQILSYLPASVGAVASLTRDPQTNTFYTVGGLQAGGVARLFTVNPNTGQTTLVATLSQSNLKVEALAAAPHGLLYATSNDDNTLYTIDTHTGQVAQIGSMGSGYSDVYGLAFGPNGALYGYTTSFEELGSTGPGFFRLDPATAVPTVLTPPSTLQIGLVQDIAFAPDGTLWEASGEAFAPISIQTGQLIGPQRLTPPFIQGFAFLPAAAVPEPSTVLLFGAGLLGLFAFQRRTYKP